MEIFIATILFFAWLQSFLRLGLVPRTWCGVTCLIVASFPLFFHQDLSSSSLLKIMEIWTSANFLEQWCVVLVVQELLVLLGGFSLLSEYQLGERIKKWHLATFIPSVSLPVGIFFLQMLLYNHFITVEFSKICLILTFAIPAVSFITSELMRYFNKKNPEGMLQLLFNVELVLLLLAIFLPMVSIASTQLTKSQWSFDFSGLLPIVPLIGVVILSALFFAILQIINRRTKNGKHNRNS